MMQEEGMQDARKKNEGNWMYLEKRKLNLKNYELEMLYYAMHTIWVKRHVPKKQ